MGNAGYSTEVKETQKKGINFQPVLNGMLIGNIVGTVLVLSQGQYNVVTFALNMIVLAVFLRFRK